MRIKEIVCVYIVTKEDKKERKCGFDRFAESPILWAFIVIC
jgi:hypothetical protein